MNRSQNRVERWMLKIESLNKSIKKLSARKAELRKCISDYKAEMKLKDDDHREKITILIAEWVRDGHSYGSAALRFGIHSCAVERRIRRLLWSRNTEFFMYHWKREFKSADEASKDTERVLGVVEMLREHPEKFGLNVN